MTGGQGSTERHYRRLLDKLKSRSNRIFVKAQMQNRTQEQRLKKVVSTLEKDRDLCIRKAHEGIWKVPSKDCPVPRLARPEGLPSYLARPKATTLPTPAELASLLPKKRTSRYPPRAQSVAVDAARPPPKQYTRMSKRRLSEMTTDQLQIWHYRKALDNLEATAEAAQEADENEGKPVAASGSADKTEAQTVGAGGIPDTKWASPSGTKSVVSETEKTSPMDDSTAAAEESVRMVMRKLGVRPQSSPLSYSQRTRLKKKRPHTSIGTCTTIVEQKTNSNSKVLKTNYLDMYKGQMKSHVRRMSSKGSMPAPSSRVGAGSSQHRDGSLEKTTSTRLSTPTRASLTPSKFSAPSCSPEARGIRSPVKQERASTLMQQTASSTSRSSPRRQMRRVSTQIMHAGAFDSLRDEVQRAQSYRTFRRESLRVDDVANIEDVEEEELFEEMRHCRYIRWGKQDETIVEEMNANEPLQLQNQLALLTLKYTPSKTKPR